MPSVNNAIPMVYSQCTYLSYGLVNLEQSNSFDKQRKNISILIYFGVTVCCHLNGNAIQKYSTDSIKTYVSDMHNS